MGKEYRDDRDNVVAYHTAFLLSEQKKKGL